MSRRKKKTNPKDSPQPAARDNPYAMAGMHEEHKFTPNPPELDGVSGTKKKQKKQKNRRWGELR